VVLPRNSIGIVRFRGLDPHLAHDSAATCQLHGKCGDAAIIQSQSKVQLSSDELFECSIDTNFLSNCTQQNRSSNHRLVVVALDGSASVAMSVELRDEIGSAKVAPYLSRCERGWQGVIVIELDHPIDSREQLLCHVVNSRGDVTQTNAAEFTHFLGKTLVSC